MFSPYSVTTTIIWPTTDRIPHSSIFKRMQIKRIADNIRALYFYWQIGTKNLKKRRFMVEPSFFHKLDNNKWKCPRAHVQENKGIECFHSRGQRLCKFIETKESVCIRKELNSHRIGLGHQHGGRFIVLGHQYGRRDVMWKHSMYLSIYLSVWKPFWKRVYICLSIYSCYKTEPLGKLFTV